MKSFLGNEIKYFLVQKFILVKFWKFTLFTKSDRIIKKNDFYDLFIFLETNRFLLITGVVLIAVKKEVKFYSMSIFHTN